MVSGSATVTVVVRDADSGEIIEEITVGQDNE